MPELPEVETVKRSLVPHLENTVLSSVITRRKGLRIPFPEQFCQKLSGKKIINITRRGKYLLIYLEKDLVLIIHLGMSGHIRVLQKNIPVPSKHDHIDFVTQNGVTIRYNDPRRFGIVTLAKRETIGSHKLLRNIGPEPLSNSFNAVVLMKKLNGRNIAIKCALLDQKIVAGLGNIYVSESLFRSGISPKRLSKNISFKKAEKLVKMIRIVLTDAINAGGSTLNDHRRPDGKLGYFQYQFLVYGKNGELCGYCEKAKIQKIIQAGRSTFFCSNCQR
ncbi:MAG: DNA-formamidopyrimidine glycosylase [Rhodospirillaceae bacterium]|nr:DNA-formamidopyrimidine glycosylase [Rhodospirillaceae bacterium]OUT77335.1 MAG: DNA-formamidopyrimidine glycosylase [Rhodospirillaceae bacterium TMED23]